MNLVDTYNDDSTELSSNKIKLVRDGSDPTNLDWRRFDLISDTGETYDGTSKLKNLPDCGFKDERLFEAAIVSKVGKEKLMNKMERGGGGIAHFLGVGYTYIVHVENTTTTKRKQTSMGGFLVEGGDGSSKKGKKE